MRLKKEEIFEMVSIVRLRLEGAENLSIFPISDRIIVILHADCTTKNGPSHSYVSTE